jgi:hypothetical protein
MLAAGIADPGSRVGTLGWVGVAFAETGAGGRAKALAERLVGEGAGPYTTSTAFSVIAAALTDTGEDEAASRMFDAAEGQADLIEDTSERDVILLMLAEERVRVGQYAEAERAVARIEGSFSRLIALEKIGAALATAGELAEALRIAEIIAALEEQVALPDSWLVGVAKAVAATGEVAGAEAVVGMVVNSLRRYEALAEVAIGLLEAGRLVDALRIAQKVEDPAWRAVALAAVAARL